MEEDGVAGVFLGIMQNLVAFPSHSPKGVKCFLIADRILRQIALQRDSIGTEEGIEQIFCLDPSFAPLWSSLPSW